LNLPGTLLGHTLEAQARNCRMAYRSAAVYPHLVAATPEVITPAVAPRVKQWDASTGVAIESFDRVTFEQITARQVWKMHVKVEGTRFTIVSFQE